MRPLARARTVDAAAERCRFARLENERAFEVENRLCADMLDPAPPVRSQPIEAQAVPGRVDKALEPGAQGRPLGWLHLAFKNGVLHALAEIKTGPGDTAQPRPPGCVFGAHVVGDKHQHGGSLPDKGGVAVEVAAQVAGEHLRLGVGHKAEGHLLIEKGMAQLVAFPFLPGDENASARVIA